MFTFLQPILLLATAGIIVPVLIHLWNVRRGTMRKVGSIQLLKQHAHSQARSLRLSERWLLLLRCLIIIMLAMVLAKPLWTVKTTAKGWVLLEPSSRERVYHAFQSMIDSLRGAGFECRSFDTAFSPIDPAEKNGVPSNLPYWSLLKLLDQKLPAGYPAYLFTGRELNRFKGERPQLSLDLHWHSIDNIYQAAKPPSNADSMRVLVHADNATDLGYLTAALKAIQEKTQLPIVITQKGNVDWLFWLSEKPLPDSIKASNVFLYSKGKETKEPVLLDDGAVLFTRLITGSENLEPVWSNGKGQTILSRSASGPKLYFFHSRLRPGWNNMVWSAAFPEKLFDLLVAEKSIDTEDNRMIDPAQMPPDAMDEKNTQHGLMEQKDLRLLFWWLAFGLLAAERFVSWKKKRKEEYAG